MFVYLLSRIFTSTAAFFYPAYASFKTLSQRPASEEELERWLMYWAVLGTLVGVEYWAEWLLSWIPFYYTLKLLFLLYLAMPQTRGATYVYLTYLDPFLHKHESEIDSSLASIKTTALAFIQEKLRTLWQHVSSSISQQSQPVLNPINEPSAAPPPTQSHPISGPVQLLESLWRNYGSNAVITGAALIQQSAAAAAAASQKAQAERKGTRTNLGSDSVMDRRRRLEAELASLPPMTMPDHHVPAYTSSRASSSSDVQGQLRERTLSTSKFEEVEHPDGYDSDDAGYESRPKPTARTSWFGWGGGGYERVKDE